MNLRNMEFKGMIIISLCEILALSLKKTNFWSLFIRFH